jgi:hypothetical protein
MCSIRLDRNDALLILSLCPLTRAIVLLQLAQQPPINDNHRRMNRHRDSSTTAWAPPHDVTQGTGAEVVPVKTDQSMKPLVQHSETIEATKVAATGESGWDSGGAAEHRTPQRHRRSDDRMHVARAARAYTRPLVPDNAEEGRY